MTRVPDGTPEADPQQPSDVARWRKAERERLIAARMALSSHDRAAQTLAIAQQVQPLVQASANPLVSVYWPIRAEPDLRSWMRSACKAGMRIALPVAVASRAPLKFREWRPGAALARGLWNIPYPADGAEVIPTVLLVPLVGFDAHCYRLGYGGGFFDRTLADMSTPRVVIGVGYPSASIPTIYPQPHDIAMDWIVTGERAVRR